MRQDVVVSEVRYDGYYQVICRIIIIVFLSENLDKFFHHELVEPNHLFLCPRNLIITVMTRGVTSPDDKVYRIFQVLVDPMECCINEGYRRVAIRGFGAECTSRPSPSVTGFLSLSG